jgi:hypothetical protein
LTLSPAQDSFTLITTLEARPVVAEARTMRVR